MVGLDIGTSKVVAVAGEVGDDGNIELIGLGSAASYGVKRGVIVNIESTVQAIRQAINEVELKIGYPINAVYTDISGSHIRSLNSHGVVAIRNKAVTQDDVERVIDAARTVAIPADQEILHVLPQEFVIDKQDSILDPIGMAGVRLEANVHMVTCASSASQNVRKCVERCGLTVSDIILQPLASSYAVLTSDERELGVCLIDIGGGTTDIAVFAAGSICHTAIIPIAGDQITNDIAVALRTPTQHAEAIKIQYACALTQLARSDESLEVPSVGDRGTRSLKRHTLAEVVQPRYEELLGLVQAELRRSGFEDQVAAGFVLTGGSAKMEGVVELAEEVFHAPVRLGIPQYVTGFSEVIQNPLYATGVGLLLYGQKNPPYGLKDRIRGGQHPLSPWLIKLKSWLKENF